MLLKSLKILVLILPFNLFGSTVLEPGDSSEFDVNKMIMHHIKDAHEFHIMDINGHPISFPLPIILWTENGLVTFLSSEFDHDDSGVKVVSRKNQQFVKYHEKIFYASEFSSGSYISYSQEGDVLNKKPFDLSITKMVFSMFISMLLLVLIFVSTAKSYSNSVKGIPTGLSKFTEPLILFIKDEVALPMIGKKNYKKYMPFLLTLFFFIWINNVMGLIPFFPFSANLSGNIAFTLVLATITFVITSLVANKDYWKHIFWMPGVPTPMKVILAPIELLGTIIKPFSLMIRLYANITAGHVVLMSIIGLMFIFKSWIGSPLSFGLAFALALLELLVAALQAYIFTMLSALYFGSAVEEHHDH